MALRSAACWASRSRPSPKPWRRTRRPPPRRSRAVPEGKPQMATEAIDPLDELVRLQVLALRKSHESQSETIIELSKAGFGNARIADLLGTSPATVKVALHRVRQRAS